jgi:hypothetical protein
MPSSWSRTAVVTRRRSRRLRWRRAGHVVQSVTAHRDELGLEVHVDGGDAGDGGELLLTARSQWPQCIPGTAYSIVPVITAALYP